MSVPDGSYAIHLTASDQWGNTRVQSIQTIVDNMPPIIGSPAPAPMHNTISRRPTVSVSIADALSGVDLASRTIDIDGNRVASGTASYTPTVDLSLGFHTVQISVRDIAGTPSSLSWTFHITSLSASPADVEVASQTIPVNPENKIPPPPPR